MAATALIELDDVQRARATIGDRLHRTPIFTSAALSRLTGARRPPEGRALPAHRLVQAARRARRSSRRSARRSGARRDRDLGRQPRAGARLRRRARGRRRARRHVAGRERAEDRGDARLRRDRRPRGRRPERGVRPARRAARGDRPHARAPVRRPARDRRARAPSALEIVEDVPDATSSSCRSAAAASISGIATAVKGLAPDARVIAVEPETSAALHARPRGRRAGRRSSPSRSPTG